MPLWACFWFSLWACFWFSLAPFPFPSCGQQKHVHMDAFLLSAGSPPLEKQKHAPMGVFLLFVGSPPFLTMPIPETHPQGLGNVTGFATGFSGVQVQIETS